MPQLQDVFWSGFADEVEKLSGIAGKLGKGALIAGGLGLGAKALAGGGDKPQKPGLVEKTQGNIQSRQARIKAQMDAAE